MCPGGGGRSAPLQFFARCAKTVGSIILIFCDFSYIQIPHLKKFFWIENFFWVCPNCASEIFLFFFSHSTLKNYFSSTASDVNFLLLTHNFQNFGHNIIFLKLLLDCFCSNCAFQNIDFFKFQSALVTEPLDGFSRNLIHLQFDFFPYGKNFCWRGGQKFLKKKFFLDPLKFFFSFFGIAY